MNPIASSILLQAEITIGEWNELISSKPGPEAYVSFHPNQDALRLYVAAKNLAGWLRPKDHLLVQIDNSTAAFDDELDVFAKVAQIPRSGLDIYADRTYVISRKSEGDDLETTAALLIHFMLLFSWHTHLVPGDARKGKRIAIQDGLVCLFGDDEMDAASRLIRKIEEGSCRFE